MKYRTRPSSDICSLEEFFTGYLGLQVPIVPQTASFSNKHTVSRLFLSQTFDQYADIDEIFANSVFKDSELDRLKCEVNSVLKPIHYIVYPNENFPTGSKLSVLFSNIANKNYTGKEQAPDVRSLLHAVDYNKFCHRISALIDSKTSSSPEISHEIDLYINSVLSTDSKLAHYCQLFNCASPSEYMTTFLLYAFFDDINWVSYADEISSTKCNISSHATELRPSENPLFKNISDEIRRLGWLQTLSTYALTVIYFIQMVIAVVVATELSSGNEINTNSLAFNTIMLCLSTILTGLKFIPFTMHKKSANLCILIEHSTLKENDITRGVTYKCFHDCSESFNRAQRVRLTLIVIFCALGICYAVLSLSVSSFPVMVALVSITHAIFLILEGYTNDISIYKKYGEHLTPPIRQNNSAACTISATARMYAYDYDVKRNVFRHKIHDRITNYDEDCIRYIYNQAAGSSTCSWNALSAIIITSSYIGITADIVQLAFPGFEYFKIPDSRILYYLTTCLILINGITNIVMLMKAGMHYQKIAELSYYAVNPAPDGTDASKIFRHNLYSENISDLDISRGVYDYNMHLFEKNVLHDDIKSSDNRYHLMYDVIRKMHLTTRVNLCMLGAYFSIAVWHMNNLKNAIAIPFLIPICAAWTHLLYPVVKTHFVAKEIRNLDDTKI